MIAKLSKAGIQALKILNQPPPRIDIGTSHEGLRTPYFQNVDEYFTDKVRIVVQYDKYFNDSFGESDCWDKSEECILPAVPFYDALSQLEAGKDVSLQLQADIVKTESAWGADCEHPRDTETHQDVQILLQIGISEDMKTVTLKLLLKIKNEFSPYVQLEQKKND